MDSPLVTLSKEILGGTPVFYGTRVPVQTLNDHILSGDTLATFLDNFPSVSKELITRYLEAAQRVLIAFYNESS